MHIVLYFVLYQQKTVHVSTRHQTQILEGGTLLQGTAKRARIQQFYSGKAESSLKQMRVTPVLS